MIIDFNEVFGVAEFLDKFKDPKYNSEELFIFKNVKILKDLYLGEIYHFNQELYHRFLNKGLVTTKYEDQIYLASGSTCDFKINDDRFCIIVDDATFEIEIYDLDTITIDIQLTKLGERCLEKTTFIDEIFDIRDNMIKVDKFYECAPKLIVNAFYPDEVYNHFIYDTCESTECDDINIQESLASIISDNIRNAVKGANNGDIEGPDDVMICVNKYGDTNTFGLKGRLVCCFYSKHSKINYVEIRKLLLNLKFDNIEIYDIDTVPDTPGISMNGIYSSDTQTYFEIKYKTIYDYQSK